MFETLLTEKEKREIEERINSKEQDYIYKNLRFYIEKMAVYERISDEKKGWILSVDNQTVLRYQVLDYIIDHFDLYELYYIFHDLKMGINASYSFRSIRRQIIKAINDDEAGSQEEKNQFKRKIWHTDPIIIGLIFQMVNESDLFFDREEVDEVYPDL